MSDSARELQPAVAALMPEDLDELYRQLARQQIAAEHAAGATSIGVDSFQVGPVTLPGPDDLLHFGEAIFAKYRAQVYELYCGTSDLYKKERDEIAQAATVGENAVGAALGAALIAVFPIVAPVAAVVATIALKVAYETGKGIACDRLKPTPAPA